MPAGSIATWSPRGDKIVVWLLTANDKDTEVIFTISADGTGKKVLLRLGPNGPELVDDP